VLTKGRPVPHFVVLLQEVYRSGPDVPLEISPAAYYSDEIFPSRELGVRRDVTEVADSLGLYVYYVPSMRNGNDKNPPEDRGNAILSTLPLKEYVAWELPLWVERRVAIGASVSGTTTSGRDFDLSFVNVHLDLRTKFRSFFRSFGYVRERQMEFILANLDSIGPAVMGGDFNTWLGEREEPAIEMAREEFGTPDEIPSHGTLKFGAILERQADYLFFRLPPGWSADYRRIEDTYGSDHYPLLGFIRFGDDTPGE
jgi:endonuclease/exonuclease/phosphatase family metal-dependent hydrolase